MSPWLQKVLAAVAGLLLLAGLAMLVHEGLLFGDDGGILTWIAGAALAGSAISLAWPGRRARRTLLWCRTFDAADREHGIRNRWHWRVLEEACDGIALPVTLQDTSVEAAQSLAGKVGRSVQVLGAVGSLGVLLMLLASGLFDDGWSEWLLVPLAIGLVTLPPVLGLFLGRAAGTLAAEPGQVAERIHRARVSRFPAREMLVLRCDGRHWRECVAEAMATVDLILIDLTRRSDAIDWEVAEARRLAGHKPVLLWRAVAGSGAGGPTVLAGPVPELCYDAHATGAEIAAWHRDTLAREDKGEAMFLDDSAPLGDRGRALAAELRDWLKNAPAGETLRGA